MHLRLSDIQYQLLRPVGVYSAEFSISGVRTRHAGLLRFYDSVQQSDFCHFDIISALRSSVYSGDHQKYSFSIGLRDSLSGLDALSFAMSSGFTSSSAPVDYFSCGVRVFVRDSVFAGSGFSISGGPYLDNDDTSFASDAFYSSFEAGMSGVCLAADTVILGMRYLIDCFFGGFSFGGSPFGGRVL